MKALVLYYSRTGVTAELAEKIAKALNCDITVIEDEKPRKGMLGFMRSGKEALFKKIVPIKLPDIDFASFDLVVVGTPIWAATLSAPMRSFLTKHASALKCVAAFSTASEKKDFKPVFEEFTSLKGYLHLSTKQVKKEDCSAQIETFINSLTSCGE